MTHLRWLLVTLISFGSVIGTNLKIHNASELIELSNQVNKGTSFSGTTVFLESDINFNNPSSGANFDPIGNTSSREFRGTFDGQGYMISNLVINGTAQYSGLFGYSYHGITIRNIIIDSTCSVQSSYNSKHIYIGGIFGYYYFNQFCTIENSINMGSVSFDGSASSYSVYIGGLAGYIYSSTSNTFNMVNCVNYGAITKSGCSLNTYIGGVAGYFYGGNPKYIQNCINYGGIINSGSTTTSLYIGGIVGEAYYVTLYNCVSAGKITSTDTAKNKYVGSIAGYVSAKVYIYYSYWANDIGVNTMNGTGTAASTTGLSEYDTTTFKLPQTTTVFNYTGTSLIDALNSYSQRYYTYNNYSYWLLNTGKKSVSFTINNRTTPLTLNSQIILMPSFTSESNIQFNGWHTDINFTSPLTEFKITKSTKLYGDWSERNYTVTFDTRGGTEIEPVTAYHLSIIECPSTTTKEGCTLFRWENDYGDTMKWNFTVPAHNITLHAVWSCLHIKTAEDFVSFSKVVNSGSKFNGTTVFLESDINVPDHLSWQFNTIGKYSYFCGTFDGLGHTISNLKISSALEHTGLFGYSSQGVTIRNIVLDSTCSVESSYASGTAYLGGILGYYHHSDPCKIENNVNMASVTFTGNSSDASHRVGGIVGYIQTTNGYVKNCANYGTITKTVTSDYTYIGGIVGYFQSSYNIYIYNCINYGAIIHSNTTSRLYLGGITGHNYYVTLYNCVSAGKITLTGKAKSEYVGSITGYVFSKAYIYYSYWANDIGVSSISGSGTPEDTTGLSEYDATTFKLPQATTVFNYTGTSLIDALNSYSQRYYTYNNYSHWLLNTGKKSVSLTINTRTTPFTLKSQIILMPEFVSDEDMCFDGWYTDINFASPLTESKIIKTTKLYGKFEENSKRYTVTFDTRGGTEIEPVTAYHLSIIECPSTTTKEGCTLFRWENDYGDTMKWNFTVPAHNITLHAVWSCLHIKTAEDLVSFSKVVNYDPKFNDTTVFLESDINVPDYLSYQFNPITNNHYQFTFDGLGHTISNLKISGTRQYTGLFGSVQKGVIIRNIVLDSTCSVESSYVSGTAYLGGILGYYYHSDTCNIENSVNMASVTFTGNSSDGSHYIGGIVGYIQTVNGYVKNCANYGTITKTVTSDYTYIGGIVGYYQNSYRRYIYNCINYGAIIHSNTTTRLYLGGITGYGYYVTLYNCVSAGKITLTGKAKSEYIGGIAGYVSSYTYIYYSYWANDIGVNTLNGTGTTAGITGSSEYDATTFKLPQTTTVFNYTGTSLIDALNSYSQRYYTYNNYSHWLLNTGKKSVSFTINNRTTPLTLKTQIILMPEFVSEEDMCFDGWYTDINFTSPLTEFKIAKTTKLYGKFEENSKRYTVTFDTRGGTEIEPVTAYHLSIIECPSTTTKEGCTLFRWENDYGDTMKWNFTVPAHNITLHAVWSCLHIKTAEDLVSFSKVVNSGSNFNDTTVFLESDINVPDHLSYQFNTIGRYSYFCGTFDGLGHTISNLKISGTLEYAGLFGYAKKGATIRNIVLDSTCSVESYYVSGTAYLGGILGSSSSTMPSVIENNVNMASVTFTGNSSDHEIFIGGIVGNTITYSNKNTTTIKNCANYGTITKTVTSDYTYIGGIVGCFQNTYARYIYNCINYGAIIHSNTTSTLYIGGILGRGYYETLYNCVNAGKITSTGKAKSDYVGSIIGLSGSYNYLHYCFWGKDVGVNTISGTGTPKSMTGSYNHSSTFNSTLIDILNNHTGSSWNKWILNPKSATATFKISNNKKLSLSSQIILLPNPVSYKPFKFNGWYTDTDYTVPFEADSISKSTALYGFYNGTISVTFDAAGGSVFPSSKNYTLNNFYTDLPTPQKEEHIFIGWYTGPSSGDLVDSTTVVSSYSDYILYAHWTPIQYTISFEPNGGNTCANITQDYDSPLTLPEPSKNGYEFLHWCNDSSLEYEYTSTKMQSGNITLYAKWDPINCTVDFDTKGGDAESSVNVTFGKNYSGLPTPTKEGCEFLWWYMEDTKERIGNNTIVETTEDHVLCAVWNVNLVSFNATRGDNIFTPVNVTYNKKYGNLPVPSLTGYSFLGWFTIEEDRQITNETIVDIPYPHTLYARWKINNYTVTFDCDNGSEPTKISLEYNEVIYCPTDNPQKKGYTFSGWNCTPSNVPDHNVTIKAIWVANIYSVLFDANGGDKLIDDEITVLYGNKYGNLPTATRVGHSFFGWFTVDNKTITNETIVDIANNHTLYAYWMANEYIVTLDVNGGDKLADNKITVTYNSTYEQLPTPDRKGHTFAGWFTEKNESVTKDTVVIITDNQILYAHWDEIVTSHVEIVFEKKDLTDNEIIEIVKQFTDAEFTITKIEDEKTGEIKVIIKFVDVEKAEEFVRTVKKSSGSAKGFIREVEFSKKEYITSISAFLSPIILFNIFFLDIIQYSFGS